MQPLYNSQTVKLSSRWLLLIVITSLLMACAPKQQTVKKPDNENLSTQVASGEGWWTARYRFNWPEGEKPNWMLGTLVAGEMVAPVLTAFDQDIKLWRFHRRAARDGHDHVFSFIFYSSAETAQQIFARLRQDPLLQQLRDEQQIIWTGFDNTAVIRKPEISATSDRHWPEAIQKSWTEFIMGASRMWLDLVLSYDHEIDADVELLERYQTIQNKINQNWLNWGRHAWFHHLNALFAYQPLLMRY